VQENLERLKLENPLIYENMYAVLAEVIKRDAGQMADYPLDFAREILKMYAGRVTPEMVYEEYKMVLEHRYQTLN
jgi:hypothetical protein